RSALYRTKLIEDRLELVMIELDPAAAKEVKTIGPLQQSCDLGFRQLFPIERYFHLEIEERIRADACRVFATERGHHPRASRTSSSPRARDTHDHARRFEHRKIFEELKRLRRCPAQWMIDLATVDHRSEPFTFFSGTLNRQQQRQEFRLV